MIKADCFDSLYRFTTVRNREEPRAGEKSGNGWKSRRCINASSATVDQTNDIGLSQIGYSVLISNKDDLFSAAVCSLCAKVLAESKKLPPLINQISKVFVIQNNPA